MCAQLAFVCKMCLVLQALCLTEQLGQFNVIGRLVLVVLILSAAAIRSSFDF
jgi:hypothetical protein